MKRVGILGGTFNPVHIGHLAIAQTALEKMKLEKVIFVPANIPPHKTVGNAVPGKDRLNMVRLAIRGNPAFEVSDFELKKQETSYTIDTMKYFRSIFPRETEIFFIIGGDLISQLEKWRFIRDILKIAGFIVVNRPGRFRKKTWIKHHAVSMPGIDISSSYVRQRIMQGSGVKYFVPDAVIKYINKNHLYKNI